MPSKKKIWSGPKEWRPQRPEEWMNSPLLSPEENKRISFLFSESKRTSSSVTPADAAYAMRYEETLLIEFSYRFQGPFTAANLLDYLTSSQPTGAVMLIRPYIKVDPPTDLEAISRLRQSSVIMQVDGDRVLQTPIDDHLVFADGSFPKKNRWKFRPLSKFGGFSACPLAPDGNAYISIPEGIACPNGSRITVGLVRDVPFDGDLALTTGLVAARYTLNGGGGMIGTLP